MNVLVIAPHPDDETIGCGGILHQHARKHDRVLAVFLSSGELGLKHLPREKAWAIREAEARKAAKVLGLSEVVFLRGPDWTLSDAVEQVANSLQTVLGTEQPQVIYLPHPQEWHPDHKGASLILAHALGQNPKYLPELRSYEVWTPLTAFDVVEDITPVMPLKMLALRAYASQLKEFNYVRAVRGLNAFRGEMSAKTRYAEVFQRVSLEGLK